MTDSAPGDVSLASLLKPLSVRKFLSSTWPTKPAYLPPSAQRGAALQRLKTDLRFDELVSVYDSRISLRKPNGYASRSKDAADALMKYDAGYTLYFRNVEASLPRLGGLVRSTASALGIPSSFITLEVFASKASSGVPMHSDYDANIQILLSGRKRWRIASNDHIRNQSAVCLPGEVQHDPFQLDIADRLPFPTALPSEAKVIDADAGGLIFVPRGWWHETEASGTCLALNVVVKGPQWAQLVAQGLLQHLQREPDWREFAQDLSGRGTISAMTELENRLHRSGILTLSARTLAEIVLTEFNKKHRDQA